MNRPLVVDLAWRRLQHCRPNYALHCADITTLTSWLEWCALLPTVEGSISLFGRGLRPGERVRCWPVQGGDVATATVSEDGELVIDGEPGWERQGLNLVIERMEK